MQIYNFYPRKERSAAGRHRTEHWALDCSGGNRGQRATSESARSGRQLDPKATPRSDLLGSSRSKHQEHNVAWGASFHKKKKKGKPRPSPCSSGQTKLPGILFRGEGRVPLAAEPPNYPATHVLPALSPISTSPCLLSTQRIPPSRRKPQLLLRFATVGKIAGKPQNTRYWKRQIQSGRTTPYLASSRTRVVLVQSHRPQELL